MTKIYTGLALTSFAVVAASKLGVLPSSFIAATSDDIQAIDGSLRGWSDYALFAVPVAAFGGGVFFKLRSDKVFQNMDVTKKALNETQTMIIESQNRAQVRMLLSSSGLYCIYTSVLADNIIVFHSLRQFFVLTPHRFLFQLKRSLRVYRQYPLV